MLILDLNAVFFISASKREQWSYPLVEHYEFMSEHAHEVIFMDRDAWNFFSMLRGISGLCIMFWCSKSDSNLHELLAYLKAPHDIRVLGRDFCKKNPAAGKYAVQKRLSDVWDSAGLNERGDFGPRNTLLVDDTMSKMDCNPPNNVLQCVPINVQRSRGSKYLCSQLFFEIVQRFGALGPVQTVMCKAASPDENAETITNVEMENN